MAEKVTWTVEEIEGAAARFEWNATQARKSRAVDVALFWDNDAAMLRAFAAQTRQVEAMRKWLDSIADVDNCYGHAETKFAALFPKDGAQ